MVSSLSNSAYLVRFFIGKDTSSMEYVDWKLTLVTSEASTEIICKSFFRSLCLLVFRIFICG